MAGLVALAIAACGATGPALRSGDPARFLVRLNQMASSDFTAYAPSHATSLSALMGQSATGATDPQFLKAATEEFSRSDAALGVANGPVDVVASAATFSSLDAAARWYSAYAKSRLAIKGATEVSAGRLGDEATATVQTAQASADVTAVQIVVCWRHGNILNVVIARGRYGGTRLDDALYLALRQDANEA